MNRRQLVAVALVSATTALLLALLVALTFGTRWGYDVYLFPYAIVASLLPLAGALATRRFRVVLPAILLPAGVAAFVGGVVWDGAYCLQSQGAWPVTYDPARNVIRYGGTIGTCRADPNVPVVLLGYALTTVGTLQSLNALTAGKWSPIDLYALTGLERFAPRRR